MATAAEQIRNLVNAISRGGDVSQFLTPELGRQVAASQSEWRKEFPKLSWELGDVVESGDRVGFRYIATGVHGETGRSVSWAGSGIGRFRDNVFQSLRVNEDYLGRLVAIGGELLDSGEDDITGDWKGDLFGIPFDMPLQQTPPSNKVTGTISALGSSIPVSGTNTPPTVNLGGSTPKGPVTFVGQWANDNQINGILNGAGFDNQPVVITR